MKKSKHNVSFRSGRIHDAVIENLERHLEGVIAHYQDPDVSTKPSTINLKITVLPSDQEGPLAIGVASTCTLAPRKPTVSIIYGTVRDGVISASEEDPRQTSFALDGSIKEREV